MAHKRLIRWLEQIYATADSELSCDQLQAMLPLYVELEVAGQLDRARFSQIRAHLRQCSDCAQEYEGLRSVVELEAEGRLPEVEELLAQFEEAERAPEQMEPVAVLAP